MSIENVEDMYPLSPMQQGMLFHSLYSAAQDYYFQQVSCKLEGELDLSAFEKSWRKVIDRNHTLRTAFVWEDLDEPVQIVYRNFKLPLDVQDWRDVAPAEQETRLENFLSENRLRRFDLSDAPLMRLDLIRLTDHTYHFTWSYHHLLLDGWSIPVVLKEVFTFYNSFCLGQSVNLDSNRPYRDYIAWLQQQDLQKAEAFWRRRLKGVTAPTPLGFGRSTGDRPVDGVRYGEQRIRFTEEITAELHAVCRRNRITVNTLVQGAWALLLSRYSSEKDVVFGATLSGRPPELNGVDTMVGLFINTLPVRAVMKPKSPVMDWLKELQNEQVESRDYEYSQLALVQVWSDVPRGRPLFESILVFENQPVDSESLEKLQEGRKLEIHDINSIKQTNYPLAVGVSPHQEISVVMNYHRDRLDDETISRLLTHYVELLKSIAANPDQPLARLDFLSQSELIQLISDFNPTFSPLPDDACLHHLFERQADASPLLTALQSGPDTLSYLKLDQTANRLAHQLQTLGVGPDVLVAICLPASIDLIASMLATLKAGGAYAPLDPSNPYTRLSALLDDISPPVLVTNSELAEEMPAGPWQVICLDTGSGLIDREASRRPDCLARADNLAYVMHTSGSTGRPKGVMVTHRGLVNYVSWAAAAYGLREGSVVPMHTRASFDLTVTSLYPALVSGGSVEVIEEWEGVEWVKGRLVRGYELVKLTPTHLEMIGALVKRQDASGWARRLVVGGEALRGETVRQWRERAPATRVINEYGPTETVVGSVAHEVGEAEEMSEGVAIGRPIANTEVYVLDEEMRMVARGVKGEIYIGGEGLARGYLNRAGETAERFVPDSYSGRAGARLYRSGDIGRHDEGGRLEYLGRRDEQVKVRGYRIEMVEVEEAMGRSRGVEQRAAVVKGEGERKRIVGYVTGAEWLRGEEVRESVKKEMPEYMVPVEVVVMKEMPVTRNGKVDRRKLEERGEYAGRGRRAEEVVGARTATEEALVDIWKQVLKLGEVSVHDNFFELGGHSLLATQIISRLREVFRLDILLNNVFDAPTIAQLADVIESAMTEGRSFNRSTIKRVSRGGGLPLSFAQQRLWFLDQLEPGGFAYNVPYRIRLKGDLNIDSLERSLSEIIARHETLRTTFKVVDGDPVQVIGPAFSLPLPVIDLSALPGESREAEARRIAVEELHQPFNLEHGPLFRSKLLRLGGDEYVGLFIMHHIISDVWSKGILARELSLLYEAFSKGDNSPLPELPVQYADYTSWQRNWLKGEVLEAELSYWKSRLQGAPMVLELPADRPRPPVQTYRGATASMWIDAALSGEIKQLSNTAGVTLFMLLLAAFKALLYRYTGQSNIIVGTPAANRSSIEIEGLIGFFTNTLAIRTKISGGLSFLELLERVRKASIEAYAHQNVPFEMLVEELQPERNMSHTPIFQVMLALQHYSNDLLQLSGLELSPFEADITTAKFDLNLSIQDAGEGLNAVLEYNTDLFDRETVVQMLDKFRNLLVSATTNPDKSISELSLLTREALHRQLVQWNDTETDWQEAVLHRMFEQQVARTPEAIAVIFNEEKLTYKELDGRANQLARHLNRLGVGPETHVGICVERSVEMSVGLLGILKSGAAYVPLDPNYPKARLAFMLENSRTEVLLTQERLVDLLPPHSGRRICLDSDWRDIAHESPEGVNVRVDGDNLTYIIYTSGSTGQPKGIGLSHRALSNLINWHYLTLSKGTRTLQFASLSFDASFHEMFAAWCSGGAVFLIPEALQVDLPALAEQIIESKIEKVILPVMVLQQMAEMYSRRADELASLKEIITTGEQLQVNSAIKDLMRDLSHCTFDNHYGPSETHVVTSFRLDGDVDRWPVHPPIGKPISNTQTYILDADLRPVPVGVWGELYIGGVSLARGYVDLPDLTAEKFLPNPFAADGSRLYRTGDLARYGRGGDIEFLGRMDHQVKIRGFRVEPAEIEAVLSQHPAIEGVTVLAREDTPGDRRLVAYVVAGEGHSVSTEELRDWVRHRLPEYMVPSVFVTMDAFPLNQNGKVDRRNLPAPDQARPDLEDAFVAPDTPAEQLVAAIWAKALNINSVGVRDNFFKLGGHSLMATRIIFQMRNAFRINLPVRAMFERPTVRGMIDTMAEMLDDYGTVEEIARTFMAIESMSEEEVKAMLYE